MTVKSDLVNRVDITKADLVQAIKDYLFKGSVRGNVANLTEVEMLAVTDFASTADDTILISLVLKLDR